MSARKFLNNRVGTGGVPQSRRASDSDRGVYLPDVGTGKRKARGAGGGAVAVAMPPLETVVGGRVNSQLGMASPLSTSSDPR